MSTTSAQPLTAPSPTPPGAPTREPVTNLASVEMSRRLSTPWHEHWDARSDRSLTVTYVVTHDVEAGIWACGCPAYRYSDPDPAKRTCKHCVRCQRRRKVQWFHAYFLGWGPADLRAQRAVYEARVEQGWATDDDLCGIDAITLLTQYGDRGVAA